MGYNGKPKSSSVRPVRSPMPPKVDRKHLQQYIEKEKPIIVKEENSSWFWLLLLLLG